MIKHILQQKLDLCSEALVGAKAKVFRPIGNALRGWRKNADGQIIITVGDQQLRLKAKLASANDEPLRKDDEVYILDVRHGIALVARAESLETVNIEAYEIPVFTGSRKRNYR